MDVRWVTAFIDLPAERFGAGRRFWRDATGSELSPTRGDRGEFATLIPATGDPHLRMQQVAEGRGGIHLDLHVGAPAEGRDRAVSLGATVVADHGYVVMRSPGGLEFCFVTHHGERTVSDPMGDAAPHAVDQVCIDVHPDRFDAEAMFWSELTGWKRHIGALEEFHWLGRPAGLPMRILLQRLGRDDGGVPVRAHLDLACGPHAAEIAEGHESLGATRGLHERFWIAMTDPAGLSYCLTQRDPTTGSLDRQSPMP